MQISVIRYSISSGILGSSASLFGKLSMDPNLCHNLYDYLIAINIFDTNLSFVSLSHSFIIQLIRVLMFVSMIITNALMWTQFTKALNYCSNSLQVIVINTSANFFLTAFYGKVFFDERLSYIWWIGSVFILLGLFLMRSSK